VIVKSSSSHPLPPKKASYTWDAHHRLIASCGVALLVFLGLQGRVSLPTQLILSWNTFAFASVALAWIVLATKDPYEVRRNARLQDASATFLFSIVISAATVSLFAVGLLLASAKNLSHQALAGQIALSVVAVFLSWMLVHTLFALRYAHIYYHNAHKSDRDDVAKGLIFPGKLSPDYLDFAYFSFVVGMTCQVSDVQISARHIRRLALLHGLISFAFNTTILAMFVNIVAGLIAPS